MKDKLIKIGSSTIEHKYTWVTLGHYTHVPRSKYMPHFGKKELERQRKRNADKNILS